MVLVLVLVVVVVGGGGGVILGEVKARPKDIISFSLDNISKSKVQTSNPSSSPISIDTPARPADSSFIICPYYLIELFCTSSKFSILLLLTVEHYQHQIAPKKIRILPWRWMDQINESMRDPGQSGWRALPIDIEDAKGVQFFLMVCSMLFSLENSAHISMTSI